jgi:hypothetical protein
MGWKIINQTGTECYKSKKRQPTPENRLVFKDAHPAIADEETWNIVQRPQGTKRRVFKLDGEPNPLTGVLYRTDCGTKLYRKCGATGPMTSMCVPATATIPEAAPAIISVSVLWKI